MPSAQHAPWQVPLDVPTPDIPPDLTTRIVALRQMPLADLRALWDQTFAKPAVISNRRFLERRIAYHWQAQVYEAANPGVLDALTARIAALTAQWEAAQRAKPRRGATALPPGTVLIRGYNGTDNEVRVAADGFEYQGQRYASLSQIARLITGGRWSGPAFFGLRTSRRARR